MTGSSAFSSGRLVNAPSFALGAAARVYLDYAGFAPVDPRVVAVMRPFLEGGVGNPSAPHSLGSEARESLDAARAKVSRLFGGAPSGLIFTSGATESNNLAVKGTALRASEKGRHIIASAIEHISVLNAVKDLVKQGFSATCLPVDRDGLLDPDALNSAIRPDTVLVSVLAASGEIGTVQRVSEIGRVTRERGVPLHVDAVGAAGRIPLSVDEAGIDLLTLSSNDLYGPPGAGALWVRPGIKLLPQVLGGGQEGGYRSGTENLPAIVGMGVAADLVRAEWRGESQRLAALRDRLVEVVLARVPEARLTGSLRSRLPHHASFCIRSVKAESILMDLDLEGISASTGSVCAGRTQEPSHVLRAIGCDPEEIDGSLCFTLGRWTTSAEIERVARALPKVVDRLRAVSGSIIR